MLDIKIPKDRRDLESESIHSVTMDEFILITNSVIFKYFEETDSFKQALKTLLVAILCLLGRMLKTQM